MRGRAVRARHIIKKDEWIVPERVIAAVCRGASRTGDVFLVGFPGDAGILQLCDEMVGRALMI